MDKRYYFDHAATTPMSEAALAVYCEASKNYFANSESLHDSGLQATNLLTLCRQNFAQKLGCSRDDLIFTSGGTESNHLAILSTLAYNELQAHPKKEILVSPLEHNSITQLLNHLATHRGYIIKQLPLDRTGQISLTDYKQMITSNTALIIVQHINSETGLIQDIERLAEISQQKNCYFHVDCVQSFGKFSLDLTYISSMSAAAHKIYGPKGIGMIYLNPQFTFIPYLTDIHHELGFRSGTVNVPAIAAFWTAFEAFFNQRQTHYQYIQNLRNQLIERLDQQIQVVDFEAQSPYILGLILPNLQGQTAMQELSKQGFDISITSACNLHNPTPSQTLLALGKTEQQAKHYIRISFGLGNQQQDIIELAKSINHLINNQTIM